MTVATIDGEFEEQEEIVEGELVEEPEEVEGELVPMMNKTEAKALDKKIRSSSHRVITGLNKAADEYANLMNLLDEAREGNIHKALEYPSWTAYVKDAAQLQVSDREERKELVRVMSGKGMSQRAIAGTLGVSQKTVDRDLEGEEFESETVTATDGRKMKRTKAEKEEPEPAPVKQPPITAEYTEEVDNLRNCVIALTEIIHNDERFPKSRAKIAKLKSTDYFQAAVTELDDLLGVVIGEEAE